MCRPGEGRRAAAARIDESGMTRSFVMLIGPSPSHPSPSHPIPRKLPTLPFPIPRTRTSLPRSGPGRVYECFVNDLKRDAHHRTSKLTNAQRDPYVSVGHHLTDTLGRRPAEKAVPAIRSPPSTQVTITPPPHLSTAAGTDRPPPPGGPIMRGLFLLTSCLPNSLSGGPPRLTPPQVIQSRPDMAR